MTVRFFYPRGISKAPLVPGALGRKARWVAAMAFCVLLAVSLAPLVDWLSFREGRWAGEPWPSSLQVWAQWMTGEPPPLPNVSPNYDATEKGTVFGLFPDRLILPNENIVAEQKLEETKEISSRGGDFIPTKDFGGRDLQAAQLRGADLRGVSLTRAKMRGINLTYARLEGSNLAEAELQGAHLGAAHLRGVNLGEAQLQGASLLQAQLQGANLRGAQLQGADAVYAQLQGADLSDAQLQGADLAYARLVGANLRGAQLQGANLLGAQLQGVDLSEAQLQGAALSEANLADSIFDETFVFRTDITGTDLTTAAIGLVISDQVKRGRGDKAEPLTTPDLEAWLAAAEQFARRDELRPDIARFFARLRPDFRTADQDASDRERWKTSAAQDPKGTQHLQRLATGLGDLACNPDGAPYVARALVGKLLLAPGRLAELGDQLEGVRKRMKDGRKNPDACQGVAEFTVEDWRNLDAIEPR